MGSIIIIAISGCDITPHKDSAMNRNIVIVVLVQLILACTPLAGHSLDQDKGPDQLWNIDRELFQDCLRQRESIRAKNHRMVLPRSRVRVHDGLRKNELLQELLAPEVVRLGSIRKAAVAGTTQKNRQETDRQENLLLKEFTAESSHP